MPFARTASATHGDCLGGGLITGGVLARDRYSSGGELLISAGVLTVLIGIVQLVLPAKNASVVVALRGIQRPSAR